METQKISQDVVSSLNINKIETVSAFQKYINVYAQSQITSLNNQSYQQETFELSSDSLAFLINDFTIYLNMVIRAGEDLTDHEVYYKNSTQFLKSLTIRTGSGQQLFHISDNLQIIGNSYRLRNQLSHYEESFDYKTCKFPADRELLQFNTQQQEANYQYVGTFAGGANLGQQQANTINFVQSISLKKLVPLKQFLKLSDSAIYLTFTYNKPSEFLFLKDQGTLVQWNLSTFNDVKTMLRCNQQMDSQINQTLKQLYENTMYPFDYYTLKQASINDTQTSFNYSCQLTRNDGQSIKGLIIALIKDDISTQNDYHDDVINDTKIQSLQLYFDSQQIDIIPYANTPTSNFISKQQHCDLYYYDFIQSDRHKDSQQIGGYQFGQSQSFNMNLQLTLRATPGVSSKLVIFTVGQKYLKQSNNQVMVL